MKMVSKKRAVGWFFICCCFFHTFPLLPAKAEPNLVIKNARIIDGNGGIPITNGIIIITGEHIVQIGKTGEITVPKEGKIIDAKGKTVMPGLADMHIHFMGGWDGNTTELLGFQRYLNAYLYSGVTTIMDMGNIEPYIMQIQQEVHSGRIRGPRIYCVGPLIDGPDVQWPSFSVSITSNAQIPALVQKLKSKNVDFLKAYKGLSFRNISSLVYEGKQNSLKVIVDQGYLNGSYELAQLDIEAFAHLPEENEISTETINLMKAKYIKCMTTLAVIENYSHKRLKDLHFLKNPLIKDTTPPWFLEQLVTHSHRELTQNDRAKMKRYSERLNRAKMNLKKMYDAGILLIAGTDAPYPGVFQGEGIHRELELIVDSGLTPLQAITLATKNAAELLQKQHEWGTLMAGKTANILIIDGRPDVDISHTRNIEGVIFRGKMLNRDELRFDIRKDQGFRAAKKVEN